LPPSISLFRSSATTTKAPNPHQATRLPPHFAFASPLRRDAGRPCVVARVYHCYPLRVSVGRPPFSSSFSLRRLHFISFGLEAPGKVRSVRTLTGCVQAKYACSTAHHLRQAGLSSPSSFRTMSLWSNLPPPPTNTDPYAYWLSNLSFSFPRPSPSSRNAVKARLIVLFCILVLLFASSCVNVAIHAFSPRMKGRRWWVWRMVEREGGRCVFLYSSTLRRLSTSLRIERCSTTDPRCFTLWSDDLSHVVLTTPCAQSHPFEPFLAVRWRRVAGLRSAAREHDRTMEGFRRDGRCVATRPMCLSLRALDFHVLRASLPLSFLALF
jgi:hypothetical protein